MTRLIESQRRRLLHHGFIFLFVAVWLGIGTATLPHPRAWLAAHLTAFFVEDPADPVLNLPTATPSFIHGAFGN